MPYRAAVRPPPSRSAAQALDFESVGPVDRNLPTVPNVDPHRSPSESRSRSRSQISIVAPRGVGGELYPAAVRGPIACKLGIVTCLASARPPPLFPLFHQRAQEHARGESGRKNQIGPTKSICNKTVFQSAPFLVSLH